MQSYTVVNGSDTNNTEYTYSGYNRASETVTENGAVTSRKSYSYDESDWLLQVNDTADPVNPVTITYSYDNNGNTVRKSDSSKPNNDTVFDYDATNRLIRAAQTRALRLQRPRIENTPQKQRPGRRGLLL